MRVLLAVDGSRYSQVATGLIESLNVGPETEVTVLTVIPEHIFLGGRTLASFFKSSASAQAQVRAAQEEKAAELLSASAKRLSSRALSVDTMVRIGSPAEEIIKACAERVVDLAVVGLKGTSDSPEFLLGGVAHKVIKYAPCTVLVAKGEPQAVNRVLVPLDGSEYSALVVDFLLRVTQPPDTEVLLIAVVQSYVAALMGTPTLDMEANRRIFAEVQRAEEEAAERLVAEAAVAFRQHGYRVTAMVSRGDPSQQILQEAVHRNVDLIALGAKGLTGVASFILGSVAQRVTRHARCSVLVVRPPKRP